MDDSKMDAFLTKTGKGLVSSVRFPSVDDDELKGSFAPHAKVKKISP
jgi:hypothetical protein